MGAAKRATVYFDPEIHRALRIKAAASSCPRTALPDAGVRHHGVVDSEISVGTPFGKLSTDGVTLSHSLSL